jgi:hypothetical protein
MPFMRIALAASLHARLAAYAPRGVDEEMHVCWNRHNLSLAGLASLASPLIPKSPGYEIGNYHQLS